MKNAILFLLICVTIVSCQKKDIDALRRDLDAQKDRITNLETAVNSVNSNIKTLQSLTDALQKNITVKSYAATSVGYLLTMSDGSTIELKNGINGINGSNGTNGKDGVNGKDGINAPLIGVKTDADGNYYWTIGGDFLLQNGQKLRVTGNNGQNGENGTSGATPLLKVDSGSNRWLASYDNGQTWSIVTDAAGNSIPATGAQGPAGTPGAPGTPGVPGANGVSNFSITDHADALIITYNGTAYMLSKTQATPDSYKMVLVSDVNIFDPLSNSISIKVQAAPADRADVWIDLNNDKKMDVGEKINNFEDRFAYVLSVSKTVTIYGKVTGFDCSFNQLTDLNVSRNPALTSLNCAVNQLEELDLSKNPALTNLNCSYNSITTLNLSANVNLNLCSINRNKIKNANMTALLNSLPNRSSTSKLTVFNDPSDGNTAPSSAEIAAANAKNWKLYKEDDINLGPRELVP